MNAKALKIKTKTLSGSRICVTLQVDASQCQAAYEEALSKLSRSVRLPGFRQGKIPRAVVLQQVGGIRIKASAIENLLEQSWQTAIKEESIETIGEPKLEEEFEEILNKFKPSESLSFNLITDVAPSPKLKKYKDLEAEFTTLKFEKAKVDELIEQSRKQFATLIPVENRSAQMGDIAVVSFKGSFEDGKEIKDGSAESLDIELEKGRMIPGFVEGVVGMSINESKTLKCQFPNDYSQEDAKGKKAIFEVNLKELKIRELPILDDNFAKQVSDKSTLEELRQELEKQLKEENENKNIDIKKEALINSLVEQLEVDLPESLVDREVRSLVEQTAQKFAQQGMDVKSMFTPELVKSLMDSSREEAKESLRKKLALQALAKEENIEISEKEISKKVENVKKELSKEKNIDGTKLRNIIYEEHLESTLCDWLMKNSQLKEKKQSKQKDEKNDGVSKEIKSKSNDKDRDPKKQTNKANTPKNKK